MNYQDSIAQSAEYLRQAIPIMTRQAAALHPVSYALWYEYVSGRNKALRSAVDNLLKDGAVLDEATTISLFKTHVADLDEEMAKKISVGFQRVMSEISDSASQTKQQADLFGNALEEWSGNNISIGDDLGIGDLLENTRAMQNSISVLKGQLNNSQREIEQLRTEVSRARDEAVVDGLTGLMNRRGFDPALIHCLDTIEPGSPGPCVLMVDIDHFKNVNDTYGHIFGDRVIRAVAQIIKSNVKGRDTAARYGGEEFVIILPETPIEGAAAVAEKIRATVECSRIKRAGSSEVIAKITVSVGVACYLPGEAALALVERADRALYESKNTGRNRVSCSSA